MHREPMKVLVVEDSAILADAFAESIRKAGNIAYVARTGASAVTMAKDHAPHAVLLDIGLPDMSGYDAVRTMREQGLGKNTVVIVVTGRANDQTTSTGIDLVLQKPVEGDLLCGLIDYLSQRRMKLRF